MISTIHRKSLLIKIRKEFENYARVTGSSSRFYFGLSNVGFRVYYLFIKPDQKNGMHILVKSNYKNLQKKYSKGTNLPMHIVKLNYIVINYTYST